MLLTRNQDGATEPLSLLVAGVLGGAGFALTDAVLGLTVPGTALRGGAQHVGYFALPLQQCLTLGLAAGVAAALLFVLAGKLKIPLPRGRFLSVPVLMVGVALSVLLLNATSGLFDGGWVSRQSWRSVGKAIFQGLLVVGTPLGMIIAAGTCDGQRRGRRAFGLLWVAFGAVLLWLNLRVYRNQYPELHFCLAVISFLAFCGGAHGLWAATTRSRGRQGLVLVAALAGILAPLALEKIDRFRTILPRVRAAVEGRVWGVAQLSFLTRDLFRGEDLGTEGAAEVDDLLKRLAPQLHHDSPDGASEPAMASGSVRERAETLNRTLPKRGQMNVLWVALDTVRADHVSALGYPRKTTPVLEALGRDATVFERAYTPYPTSAYAYSATLNSLPARLSPHYATAYRRPWKYPEGQGFPELLAARGYKTAAVTAFNERDVDNPMMFKSLRPGFQVFNPDQSAEGASAVQVTDSAGRLLEMFAADRAEPFFLWVHYLDAHDPYEHRAQFDFGPSSVDCYDSEIAFVDFHLGRLLERLGSLQLLDNTIVVVFSDHGEEFDEHGGRYHNGTVYEEQIHVPLIVRVPGLGPNRIRGTVSLLDVVPTCLEILGIPDSVRRFGRSLVPSLFGTEPDAGGLAASEVFTVRAGVHVRDERTVIVGRDKLIRRVQRNVFELFDLQADPREQDNRVGLRNPVEGRLRGLMGAVDSAADQWVRRHQEGTRPQIGDELDRMFAAVLTTRDDGAVRRAARALEGAVITGYGVPHQRVTAELEPPQVEALFDRIRDLWPKVPESAHPSLVRMLMHRADAELLDLFTGALDKDPAVAVPAAVALALHGNAAGEGVLLGALALDDFADRSDVGWALTRLGNGAGLPWLKLGLHSCLFGRPFRESVRALPFLTAEDLDREGKPTPARMLGTRVMEEYYRHPEVDVSVIEACRTWPDEDASLILLRLGRDLDVDTRRLAMEALAERMDAATLTANRSAMDEQLDGDAALLNIIPDVAVRRYLRALELGTLYNAGVRFRLARAHQLAGALPEARAVLDDLEKNAPRGYDRKLAVRRKDQLAWQPYVDDANFQCTVLQAKVPPVIRAGEYFAVDFELRNDGKEPWFGGWGVGLPQLQLRFRLPNGELYETQPERNIVNHFPEFGVHPGETVRVLVLGTGMRRNPEGVLELHFKNDRVAYKDDGLVWKNSESSRIR